MSLTDAELNQDAKTIEGLENLDEGWAIDYDDLEFGGELARGNFGSVSIGAYLGTRVAVKKLFDLDDEMKIYLQREFNVLKQIRHPNIVQFLGLSKTKEGLYIVTEYVERGDLCRLLYDHKRQKELNSWHLRLKIMVEAAQSLSFVHAKNLIHRDIKAANFLVGENWHVKLCDFGFSRSMGAAGDAMKAGAQMTLCGTDEWMAPETMMGLDYDQKADVFSFGMFLLEMSLRAEPKLRDPSKMYRFEEELYRRDAAKAGVPEGLIQVIVDCTRYEPADRPTMKEVLGVLKDLAKKQPDDTLDFVESSSDSELVEKKEKKDRHKHRDETDAEREKRRRREKKHDARERHRSRKDKDKDKESSEKREKKERK